MTTWINMGRSAILAGLLMLSGAASAQTMTQSQAFTIASPVPGDGVYFGNPFLKFDPSLGTLTGISLSVTGTTVDTGGRVVVGLVAGGISPTFGYYFNPISFPTMSKTGNGAFSLGGVDTNASDLALFTGSGTAPQIGISAQFHNDAAIVTVAPNSTITYTYTALVRAVPGPVAGASIPAALLLLGGFVVLQQRRGFAHV